ncbi:MAG: VOC family protein [Chloroflexota bacterium]
MTEPGELRFALPPMGHVGVVVRDLARTVEHYSTALGLGPFRTFEANIPRGTLHGRPASFRFSVALARMGTVDLEIIEVPPGESIYREFLESSGEGLHHLGFQVADLDAELARLGSRGLPGVQVIQEGEGEVKGYKFAYLDTQKVGGVVFEFIQRPAK